MYSHSEQTKDHQKRSAAESSSLSSQSSLQPPVLNLKASPLQRMGGMEEEEMLQGKMNPLQRMGEEEEMLQGKMNPLQRMEGMEEEEMLQGKMNPLQRETSSANLGGGGGGMPVEVQSQMESSMGADFSDVKIHANSSAAPEVGALAYAQGNDLHFAQGQYEPNTSKGQELLGHELAHVVQQREGRVQPTTEVNGVPVNDDVSLEREADNMGRMAAQKKEK